MRSLLVKLSLGLMLATTAQAQTQTVKPASSPATPTTTIQLQTAAGASCAAPPIGNCGSCAISCQTGQAAQCKPGLAVGKGASGDSCLQAPDCSCH